MGNGKRRKGVGGLKPSIRVRGSSLADMRSGLISGFLIYHTEAGPVDNMGMSVKD